MKAILFRVFTDIEVLDIVRVAEWVCFNASRSNQQLTAELAVV